MALPSMPEAGTFHYSNTLSPHSPIRVIRGQLDPAVWVCQPAGQKPLDFAALIRRFASDWKT